MNGVAPGPTDTAMLTPFTSTPENKAALVTVFRLVASAALTAGDIGDGRFRSAISLSCAAVAMGSARPARSRM